MIQEEKIYLEADKYYSYEEFKNYVVAEFEQGRSTGDEQTEEKYEATRMNLHRMKRLDKQTTLTQAMRHALDGVSSPMTWYVLVEGWCGDAAQNVPVLVKMAEYAGIDLHLIFRDRNPEIMNAYLTNGSRSIPKLIAVDNETSMELGTWGARPKAIQQKVVEFKSEFPHADHAELVKNVQFWYAKDKGLAVQDDMVELLGQWTSGTPPFRVAV